MAVAPEESDFDIFLSHRSDRHPEVAHLVESLERRGLSVWVDRTAVPPFGSITAHVHAGITRSKLVLVYYTRDYPNSRACQWELSAAFDAGLNEGDALRRIAVVVRSGEGTAHIQPLTLRDARAVELPAADNRDALDVLAADLYVRCKRIERPIGSVVATSRAAWYPRTRSPTPFPRFIGRSADLWAIHSALLSADHAQVSKDVSPGVAVVSGMAGVGKTMLAEEYAQRFHHAYPGGVVWFSATAVATADSRTTLASLEAERLEAFRRISLDLRLDVDEDEDAAALPARVWRRLSSRQQRCLVIIDDYPPDVPPDALRAWLAPPDVGVTLITTRGRGYAGVARVIDLGALGEDDARDLLLSRAPTSDPAERTAASQVCAEVGRHPLALDVLGARLSMASEPRPVQRTLVRLRQPHADQELERAAQVVRALGEHLPTAHAINIVRVLAESLGVLKPEPRAFLEFAAAIAPAPIPAWLFVESSSTPADIAADVFELGFAQAFGLCLADRVTTPAGPTPQVHALVGMVVRSISAEAVARIRSAVTATLDAVFRDSLFDHALWEKREGVGPHARTLAAGTSPTEIALARNVALHDLQSGRIRAARVALEAIASLDRSSGVPPEVILDARHHHALTLRQGGGLHEAFELLSSSAAEIRNALGAHHEMTLRAEINLANCLVALGRHDEGLARLTAVLSTVEGNEGLADLVQPTRTNIAWCHLKLGRPHEARNILTSVLAHNQRVHGPRHAHTIQSARHVAQILRSEKQYSLAEELLAAFITRARTPRAAIPPPLIPIYSTWCSVLGHLDPERARDALREAIDSIDLDTCEDPHVFSMMNNLGMLELGAGQLEDAFSLVQRVCSFRQKAFGALDPSTIHAEANLMLVRILMWDPPEVDEAVALGDRMQRFGQASALELASHHLTTTYVTLLLSPSEEAAGELARTSTELLPWAAVLQQAAYGHFREILQRVADRAGEVHHALREQRVPLEHRADAEEHLRRAGPAIRLFTGILAHLGGEAIEPNAKGEIVVGTRYGRLVITT